MAQYVSYNTASASPQPITGWYDTAMAKYANLPPVAASVPAGFVAVTAAQWSQHLSDLNASHWSVVNGVLTYTPAPVGPPAA